MQRRTIQGFENAYAEMIEVLEEHEFGIPSNIEVGAIEEILSDNKSSRTNHFEQSPSIVLILLKKIKEIVQFLGF